MVGILRRVISKKLALGSKYVWLPILYYTLGSLNVFLAVWQNQDIHQDAKAALKDTADTFDFIVVGAGSAGSVVANRLSRHYNVLLLEAGGEPNPLQAIPAFAQFLLRYPETVYMKTGKINDNWMHDTVPQQYGSLNSVNQQSSWSAGRSLGGTGSINFMLFLKGHKKDYDKWAEITGDPSWSYEGVTPHFKSLETYGDPDGDPRYHGFNGDLAVELPEYTGLAKEFVRAGQEFGYPEIDVNAPHTEGFFLGYHTTKSGLRHSPYRAFLQPIRKRKSLTIRKYSLVTKVLFKDHTNSEVYGVEYERHGKTYTAIATREVIISAGAITTPRVLMLSGIGPRHHLEELDIPVRHDLPVGENLQDHLAAYVHPFFINEPRTVLIDRDVTPGAFLQWFATGSGVLSSAGTHACAVFSSSFAKARGEGDWPDIQFLFYGLSLTRTYPQIIAKAFNLKEDELSRYYEHAINKESFVIAVSAARPYSRGYIKLGGTSPRDKLVIDPKYLTDLHDVDLKVMVQGMKSAIQLVENTTTFQNLGGRFTDVPLPGCEHLLFRSDEYIECYVRRYSVTLHHPSGTASMGPYGERLNSVVDPRLRVHGIKNLRIADASIMPLLIVTNTQAGSMMIGEKAADMIMKDWQKQENNNMGWTFHQNQWQRFDRLPLQPRAGSKSPTLYRYTYIFSDYSEALPADLQANGIFQKLFFRDSIVH